MNFGGFDTGVYGSDQTLGYSPTTMHVDPVSGLPESQAVAPGTTVVVAPSAPASSGVPWLLLLALAGVAWYGYKQGWFAGLFESEPESTMTIEKRKAA